MLRIIRAIIISLVILGGLAGTATTAAAGSSPRPPIQALDITWE